ncbi:MAG: hypothetical protein WC277_09955 [Bacilli bacterium]|jgi:hypothetical protein
MPDSYREALQDDESLATFLRCMRKFDREFCEAINAGTDFTIKLEVRGVAGTLLHTRVQADIFERPRGLVVKEQRTNG